MDKQTLPSSGDTMILRPQPAAATSPTTQSLSTPPQQAASSSERTGVFTSLVKEDSDISGLVAYSIYKQNKLDWLQAFETALGRAPNEAELASYIIGESTPRRLATYRHLAESTLAGKGPELEGGTPGRYGLTGTGKGAGPLAPRSLVLYGVIAVLFVVIFYLAAHYTVTNH